MSRKPRNLPHNSPFTLHVPSGTSPNCVNGASGAPALSAEDEDALTRAEFAWIVRQHSRFLHLYASSLVGLRDEKDLVHQVLSRAWTEDLIAQCGGDDERIRVYLLQSMRSSAKAWPRPRLRQLIAGWAYSLLMRSKRFRAATRTIFSDTFDSELAEALRALPARRREAFILVDRLERSPRVVAAVLQMSVATLRLHLTGANALLGRKLASLGYTFAKAPRAEELARAQELVDAMTRLARDSSQVARFANWAENTSTSQDDAKLERTVRAELGEEYDDYALITEYLTGELFPSGREGVEARVLTDQKFRSLVTPIVAIWQRRRRRRVEQDALDRIEAEWHVNDFWARLEREQQGVHRSGHALQAPHA